MQFSGSILVQFGWVNLDAIPHLINNAVESSDKYSPCEIKITVRTTNENVNIEISDNGRGIKKRDLNRIWERGTSIGRPGGSGLGLYGAKVFIEQQKGQIDMKSEYGKGSTVRMKLPLVLNSFQFHGMGPFEHVLIEDYKLNQLLWLNEATKRNLDFAVFSSPSEFLGNLHSISPKATIYLDSRFPDFPILGEEWAKELYQMGFKKIYMCSTSRIDMNDKTWLMGSVPKEKPFQNLENSSWQEAGRHRLK